MGLFEKIFGKRKDIQPSGYFRMLNGYSPVFTNAPGSIYEMAVTRAAIHSFAAQCSKLKPALAGKAKPHLQNILQYRPNPFQDSTKFLYRLATILSVNNTAFIVPIMDDWGEEITGYYPLLPQLSEIVEARGIPYIRYRFGTGQQIAIELDRVGILTSFQYSDDLFGETNTALQPTMQLIHTQNQGIMSGVKNSASIRFLAKISNMLDPEMIRKERIRFMEENLSPENESGVIMFDNKYSEIKQVESKPYTANALQMQAINANVYQYFGTNEAILQNKFTEDEWNAFYEAKIEPFAIQLSLVMTNMTYSQREIAHGNGITFTANRLQYASNRTKLQVSTQLFDRGILSRNDIMDIWNLAHVEDGDKRYIRKEYAEISQLGVNPLKVKEIDDEDDPVENLESSEDYDNKE